MLSAFELGSTGHPLYILVLESLISSRMCWCCCSQGPLGDVLDTQALISDVSGAGNNWAHGNHVYGPQYHDLVRDAASSTGAWQYN
jgi:hypothetical protein